MAISGSIKSKISKFLKGYKMHLLALDLGNNLVIVNDIESGKNYQVLEYGITELVYLMYKLCLLTKEEKESVLRG